MPKRELSDTPNELTLEDLLQVKRHEQPAPAFWDGFEKELKARTVRELVKKPSLRYRLVHLVSLFATRVAPLGAATALVLGFMFTAGQHELNEADQQLVTPSASLEIVTEPAPSASAADLRAADVDVVTSDLYAASDFAVDVISSPSDELGKDYETDFLPDILASQVQSSMSYAEDVISANIATLSPASFVLGM